MGSSPCYRSSRSGAVADVVSGGPRSREGAAPGGAALSVSGSRALGKFPNAGQTKRQICHLLEIARQWPAGAQGLWPRLVSGTPRPVPAEALYGAKNGLGGRRGGTRHAYLLGLSSVSRSAGFSASGFGAGPIPSASRMARSRRLVASSRAEPVGSVLGWLMGLFPAGTGRTIGATPAEFKAIGWPDGARWRSAARHGAPPEGRKRRGASSGGRFPGLAHGFTVWRRRACCALC